jgi:hypothetical protein
MLAVVEVVLTLEVQVLVVPLALVVEELVEEMLHRAVVLVEMVQQDLVVEVGVAHILLLVLMLVALEVLVL